jgi:outer membrane protein TolC
MSRFKPVLRIFLVLLSAFLLAITFALTEEAGAQSRTRYRSIDQGRLTLPQAVGIAVTRNLRMSDARLNVREKESQRRSAFSDFFPSLDFQYIAQGNRYKQAGTVAGFAASHDARRPINPITLDPYPYRIDPYRTFTLSATLTQPVYTAGKLLNDYKFSRLAVDYSEIQVEVERQDLILEVYEAYYGLMQSQKLLEVADKSIEALRAQRNQAVEFRKAGLVPMVDVLSTEGLLAQAMIQRTQAVADIERYKATLCLLMRYPQETPIFIVHDFGYQPNPYRIPQIYEVAAGNRLEIRQANISVEQALALVRSANAGLLPSVSIQASGSRTNDDWNPFDPEAINDWTVQGILSWSFDFFRKRETVRENRAAQARAFVARERLVEQIMDEVKVAYLDMKRAESDIGNNRKAVRYRRESFRISKERYKEQVATYIEVLDALRELSQAAGDYYTSLIQYRINKAVLERRMGILRN